ncbi:nucleotidyltransferase family protein [Nocardioides solisilvae]|uniref:nucleotidyltransferase family protein n=1 Tax=Nocardioides solisilvae TaxID=1542435 RepID=UPI000D748E75|nr:NTP transferase domain-containing protein [Nocardioides solisilvae]
MRVAGLLLAAGAGTRFGGPKALAREADGTAWLTRSLDVLSLAGCSPSAVVLGAGAGEARALLAAEGTPREVDLVDCAGWAEGMGASLRCGLRHLEAAPADVVAALVHLVDLPDVGAAVAARLVAAADGPEVLARAAYSGHPGHPVLLGRAHWAAVLGSARGDRGARDHLAAHPHRLVECGDLARGLDRDEPGPDER